MKKEVGLKLQGPLSEQFRSTRNVYSAIAKYTFLSVVRKKFKESRMKLYLPMKIPISSEYSGLLIYDHPNITIEYKKWSWSRFKYDVLSNTIKINDIESIKILDRGIFETRIDFQIKSLKLIENIPNISGLIIFQFRLNRRESLW